MAWGNLTGVRVEGELMDFESSLAVGQIGGDMEITGKEKQPNPRYHRSGNSQEVRTRMRGLEFHQTVTDEEKGQVEILLTIQSDTTLNQPGYLRICLTPDHYADARIRTAGRTLRINSASRSLAFRSSDRLHSRVEKEGENTVVYLQLSPSWKKGETYTRRFSLEVSGDIDHSDAHLALDVQHPGRRFAGLGGNFRLQNQKTDPLVIDYCLENLRVAYGRVEFPWRLWHSDEKVDPLEAARQGKLDRHVEESLQMAQRLKAIGMPVVLSCWFPPTWAIEGGAESYSRQGGVIAYRLDAAKKEEIYRSMADYLFFAKQRYGVEFDMFSFNESDLGIDVLHTPQQHAEFIREFGACLAERDLPTKMLLGDNSDASTFDFILPALQDKDARAYIGAVSFHSWRGCDDVTLRKWRDAARALNVPLLVGEGSTDAAAYRYPEIFHESTFALYEINLYIRMCAICQPLSILQWQLTSDYSLLWGAGIYGSSGELRPTQRFFNLKQLSATPADAFAIPVACDKKTVNCAAFGNYARGEYAVHIVNNGAACKAVIQGIPEGVTRFKVWTTNQADCMKETEVTVQNGKLEVGLSPVSFITLVAVK